MPRPIHFEIHAGDPERAIGFYTDLFGWEFTAFTGEGFEYWTIKTGEQGEMGIDGGLMRRQGSRGPADIPDDTPVIAFVCVIGVEDIDASMARAIALGGLLALPKGPVPGMGWAAYFKDTEGNVVGMFQVDPEAA